LLAIHSNKGNDDIQVNICFVSQSKNIYWITDKILNTGGFRFMDMLSDEIVITRTGEALEEELKKAGYHKKLKEIADITKVWRKGMTGETLELYDRVEDKVMQYISFYAETAYRFGVKDGIRLGMEQGADGKKTILSLEDMVHIMYIYDAVKKLNLIMLGEDGVYDKEEGVLGTLGRICDLIYNGASYKLCLLGEDETDDRISYIIDKPGCTPEERAAMLLCRK